MEVALAPCACFNLRSASRRITKRYDDILAPSGLLTSQLGLLRLIAANPGTGIAELAELLDMDVSTVTRNLRPLISAGHLVVKASRRDGRRREVRVTPKGMKAIAKAVPLWDAAQRAVIEELGPKRYEELIGLLNAIR